MPNKKKRTTRSVGGFFEPKKDCLFCGTNIDLKDNHKKGDHVREIFKVSSSKFVESAISVCDSRLDEWSHQVRGRIEYCSRDLKSVECLYHAVCVSNFRSYKQIPLKYQSFPDVKRKKPGRPKDETLSTAFEKVCEYIQQNNDDQLTVSSIRHKMRDFLPDNYEPFSNQILKQKIKDHFEGSITFSETKGLSDIISLREQTSSILRLHYTKQFENEDSKKKAIINTAFKLIKEDILSYVSTEKNNYPSSEELNIDCCLSYLPPSLKEALDSIFSGTEKARKIASIGQAIVQATCPRSVLAPLQIGLGVQVHYHTRSKFLIESLYAMGFCSSYSEVLRFEKNAASCTESNILGSAEDIKGKSVLFALDNVDHNIQTLDGKGTFHGMGAIASVTPTTKQKYCIQRKLVTDLNTLSAEKIKILEYKFEKHACRSEIFKVLPNFFNHYRQIDIMWEVSLGFKDQTPNWQGFMNLIHQDTQHPGKSSIFFLPMVNMYPGDETCIFSTLNYVCNLSRKYSVPAVVTFDQPLYWKASEIILDAYDDNHIKDIILMLGSFHTLMNLLGAIGTLMESTGLNTILSTIYGENSVVHMLTGKAVYRAIRGHNLVDKCLNKLIVEDIVTKDNTKLFLFEELSNLCSLLTSGGISIESVMSSDCFVNVAKELEESKRYLSEQSRTSRLWLLYQKAIATARTLIKADRSGIWHLHLQAVADCLPIFAAAGHYNYFRTAHFYLQQMCELEKKNTLKYMNILSMVFLFREGVTISGLGLEVIF